MTFWKFAKCRQSKDSRFNCWLFTVALLISVLINTSAFANLGTSVTLDIGQPTNIFPSEVTNIKITLTNSNSVSSINSVAFANNLPGTLPNGLKIAGAATYTCTDPSTSTTNPAVGTLTTIINTQAISLSGGIIPAKANGVEGLCTITIPVTAGSSNGLGTSYAYTIASGAVTGNDGNPVSNTGAVTQTINIKPLSLPVITKTFSNQTPIIGGAPTTLTITVGNPNSVPLPNFSITDNFPKLAGLAIIKVADPVTTTSTCTNGGTPAVFTPTPNVDDISITASGGTVAENSTCTITVSVKAVTTNGVYQTSNQTNTISGTTDFSNDIGLQAKNATAQIKTRSPLRINKKVTNPIVANSRSSSFTITFFNDGLDPLTVTSFTDDPIDSTGALAYGLKIDSAPSMDCSGGNFTATAGNTGVTQTADFTIPPNGKCVLTIPFTGTVQSANTPITFTNKVNQGAAVTTNSEIVSQSVSASVLVVDNLRILKTSSPAVVTPGSPISYTVTVQNWSDSSISNVNVNDTFPSILPLSPSYQSFLTGIFNSVDYTPTLSGTGCSGLTVLSSLGDPSATFTIGSIPARTDPFNPGSCTAIPNSFFT